MAITSGSPDQVNGILLLRTIVAALGERTTPQWWRTQFFTDVGLRALTRVFPRTAASAALNSVLIAAREDHDKRIGVGGRYHLFRLPSSLEHAINSLMLEAEFAVQTAAIVSKGRDDMLHELATMARGRKQTLVEGPIKVGPSASIFERASLEKLAAHYRFSLETSRRAFPYFEDGEDRA